MGHIVNTACTWETAASPAAVLAHSETFSAAVQSSKIISNRLASLLEAVIDISFPAEIILWLFLELAEKYL